MPGLKAFVREDALVVVALIVILGTSLVEWNSYSWILLFAAFLVLLAWIVRPLQPRRARRKKKS